MGQNLFGKVIYYGLAFETNCSNTPSCMSDIINKATISDYLDNSDGPLVNPYNIEAIGNIKINSQTPNVEYRLRNAFLTTDEGDVDMKTIGMNPKFYKKYFKHLEGKRIFSIQIILKALSSGKVKLHSCNPLEDPVIIGNYFSNPDDCKNMVDAIKFIINFMKCDSFKKFGIKFYDKPIPGKFGIVSIFIIYLG